MKTFEELYSDLMEDIESPEGKLVTSARIIQASAGGVFDEAGVYGHMRKLTEKINSDNAGRNFRYVESLNHFIAIVCELMRVKKSVFFNEMGWDETRAANILAALEIEKRMLSGAYDEWLLKQLAAKLPKIKN